MGDDCRMDDIVWYSRFAVLVGALVLLVQALSGRGAGFVTLLGVLLLCVGLVVFAVTLGLQGIRSGDAGAAEEAVRDRQQPPEVEPAEANAGSERIRGETVATERVDEPAVKE